MTAAVISIGLVCLSVGTITGALVSGLLEKRRLERDRSVLFGNKTLER